ncbi:Por secretion system C-terminal sorting domain-containing protein [Flexibacter flexilis DSM 6793]|uniref:Por secretion system C-terminal sorting domain-containing protein n=1 Tax=Flexibacter flexilis DSM 6793 TaxID=927664 RepID=A0A1I1I1J0_9BACT|nr:T9SS type A sorting domain-containing protein [Flexibacter flexilis]SFC28078.1 Por secretion system C-terminal sorting domain-containing protein [Flexibacter flexilis DSM 6793]
MKNLFVIVFMLSMALGLPKAHAAKALTGADKTTISSIFPNPCTESTRINITAVAGKMPTELKVYDLIGKEVVKIALEPNEMHHTIDLSHVQAGVYLCSLYADNKVLDTRKIVKTR